MHYLTLQMMWIQCNFAGEATFRVNVAITVVLNAAAEQLKRAVSLVGVLLISNLVRIKSHQSHAPCVVCLNMRTCRFCCLIQSGAFPLRAQTWIAA